MKRVVTLRPGARGTKSLSSQFGNALVYVRYRYDSHALRRIKTIELIVDEVPWVPRRVRASSVWVHLPFDDQALRHEVADAGGRWDAERRLWELPYPQAARLGLASRIVDVADVPLEVA